MSKGLSYTWKGYLALVLLGSVACQPSGSPTTKIPPHAEATPPTPVIPQGDNEATAAPTVSQPTSESAPQGSEAPTQGPVASTANSAQPVVAPTPPSMESIVQSEKIKDQERTNTTDLGKSAVPEVQTPKSPRCVEIDQILDAGIKIDILDSKMYDEDGFCKALKPISAEIIRRKDKIEKIKTGYVANRIGFDMTTRSLEIPSGSNDDIMSLTGYVTSDDFTVLDKAIKFFKDTGVEIRFSGNPTTIMRAAQKNLEAIKASIKANKQFVKEIIIDDWPWTVTKYDFTNRCIWLNWQASSENVKLAIDEINLFSGLSPAWDKIAVRAKSPPEGPEIEYTYFSALRYDAHTLKTLNPVVEQLVLLMQKYKIIMLEIINEPQDTCYTKVAPLTDDLNKDPRKLSIQLSPFELDDKRPTGPKCDPQEILEKLNLLLKLRDELSVKIYDEVIEFPMMPDGQKVDSNLKNLKIVESVKTELQQNGKVRTILFTSPRRFGAKREIISLSEDGELRIPIGKDFDTNTLKTFLREN